MKLIMSYFLCLSALAQTNIGGKPVTGPIAQTENMMILMNDVSSRWQSCTKQSPLKFGGLNEIHKHLKVVLAIKLIEAPLDDKALCEGTKYHLIKNELNCLFDYSARTTLSQVLGTKAEIPKALIDNHGFSNEDVPDFMEVLDLILSSGSGGKS